MTKPRTKKSPRTAEALKRKRIRRRRIEKVVEAKWRKLSPKDRDAWVEKTVFGRKRTEGAIPKYSSEISAAWQIVGRFQRQGKSVELFVHGDGPCEITISTPIHEKPRGCIFYDTIGNSFRTRSVAASICLAGLKAQKR